MLEGLTRGSPPWIQLEQYRDFVENRTLRSALLCRRDASVSKLPGGLDVGGLWVSSLGDAVGPVDVTSHAETAFRTYYGSGVVSSGPDAKAALLELSRAWPQAVRFEELHTLVATRLAAAGYTGEPLDRQAFGAGLLQLFAQDGVDLRRRRLGLTTTVSERPRASPLARWQVARGAEAVTNLHHDAFALPKSDRELLARLDGDCPLSPAEVDSAARLAQLALLVE